MECLQTFAPVDNVPVALQLSTRNMMDVRHENESPKTKLDTRQHVHHDIEFSTSTYEFDLCASDKHRKQCLRPPSAK
jgi:hypothetical protein